MARVLPLLKTSLNLAINYHYPLVDSKSEVSDYFYDDKPFLPSDSLALLSFPGCIIPPPVRD